jgi:hypothetical protein
MEMCPETPLREPRLITYRAAPGSATEAAFRHLAARTAQPA